MLAGADEEEELDPDLVEEAALLEEEAALEVLVADKEEARAAVSCGVRERVAESVSGCCWSEERTEEGRTTAEVATTDPVGVPFSTVKNDAATNWMLVSCT